MSLESIFKSFLLSDILLLAIKQRSDKEIIFMVYRNAARKKEKDKKSPLKGKSPRAHSLGGNRKKRERKDQQRIST